ncbi:hypothetical protein HJC23_007552 [Cyclotella cryptica]|uniref:Transmembrane protein n=1 Tax=Cyclotella cryptica TaxID=29204 RepID=A0ABD3QRA6_9STRA
MSSTSRMEQVFFATHSKISHSILRHSSHRFRSTVEHFVLGLAVCGFCVVLLSHVTFVHRGDFLRGGTMEERCPGDDGHGRHEQECVGRGGVSVYSILIQLIRSAYGWLMSSTTASSSGNTSHGVEDHAVYSPWTNGKQIPMSCLGSIPSFSEDADVTHILLHTHRNHDVRNGAAKSVGSRAFTVHAGKRDNELILTGMPLSMQDPVDSSMQHQLRSCFVIDNNVTTDEKGNEGISSLFGFTKEQRNEKQVPNCPLDIVALLAQHGYLTNFRHNVTHQDSRTNYPTTIYSYSHAKGLLLLSPTLKQRHNISTQFVIASSTDVNCFGEPFVQNIVFSIVGPDTVILNWVLGQQQRILRNRGHDSKRIRFVYHWKTGKEIDLDLFDMDHYAFSSSSGGSSSKYGMDSLTRHPILQYVIPKIYKHPLCRLLRFLLFKLAVFLSTLFIFFLTTSLVSFTFQETQDRMLEFTIQLQSYVRARLPLGGLIVRHILENLVFVPVMVGMIFFLIEFYGGDKFLAFMVLSMVWIAEVFSAISCPIGFTYASLGSTVLFLLHTMLFFLNRYELPAIHAGLITPEMPRMMRIHDVNNVNVRPRIAHSAHVPDDHQTSGNTAPTEPLSSPTTDLYTPISEQRAMLPPIPGPMRSYVAAASSSLQSIRSLASIQSLSSLADRASSPNWLYGFTNNSNGVTDSEDEDSYMAYVGDGARSTLSMAVDSR